jgi:alpha-tubulin suppressor-like RCC1 family protein
MWDNKQDKQTYNFPSGERFIQIACGPSHSIGLRKDNSIIIWGKVSK